MKNSKTNRTIKMLVIILVIAIAFLLTLVINFVSLKDSVNSVVNPNSKISISTSSDNDKTKSDIAKENNSVIEPTPMAINAMSLKMLVNNSWDRIKSNLTDGYVIDGNGQYIYEEGYTLYCDGIRVQNIVFNKNYKEKIVGEIKIGTTQKDLKASLGMPSFQDKSIGMVGYKTKDLYVFFYDNEISVYPNKSLNNKTFESKLLTYYYGNYNGDRTNFVLEIKREFPDFTAIQQGENVILRSINRQIEIILDENKQTEIIIYNGYKAGSAMNNMIEENNIISRQQDLAEKQEIERKIA